MLVYKSYRTEVRFFYYYHFNIGIKHIVLYFHLFIVYIIKFYFFPTILRQNYQYLYIFPICVLDLLEFTPKRMEKRIKILPRLIFVAVFLFMAPQVGLEPTTLRLTAECSTN